MKQASADREARFFGQTYRRGTRDRVLKFYRALRSSKKHFDSLLLAQAPGKEVLDYGAGTGQYSLFLARHGANVVGIDISPTAIEIATQRARKEGLDNAAFRAMDAEHLEFEDHSFDVVCGAGILHHLHLPAAMAEVVRVLKHDGKAIFREPMGHNPAINLFRRITPNLRSKGERPLRIGDLRLIEKYFHRADFAFFHLSSILLLPLAERAMAARLADALDRFDSLLLKRVPGLAPLAWHVVMLLEGPRESVAAR